MKIVIPPVEKCQHGLDVERDVCPDTCPFHSSGEMGSGCSMVWAKKSDPNDSWFVRKFLICPGENCPGPGEYQLKKITRSREDAHMFESKFPQKELVVKVLLDRSNQIMNGARAREENEAIEKAKEAKAVHQDGGGYLLKCNKCDKSIGWSKQIVEIICDSCKVKTRCTICKKEMPPSTWPWCRNCCEDPGY